MAAAERTALILLAAGRSTRFGAADKLLQDLDGRPVGLHAAATLAAMPFAHRLAVTDGRLPGLAALGFRMLVNPAPEKGMAGSLRLGIAAAGAAGAQAVLVALADMPRVTAAHVRRLLDAADGPDALVVSSDGRDPMPPALFGRDRFAALLALDGDHGARDLIRAGVQVAAAPGELADIDTPADLERLRAPIRGAARRSG